MKYGTNGFRFVFVDDNFLIHDFIAVSNASADKVSFFAAFVLSSTDLLGKFCGVIFRNADHDVFQNDPVQILRAVYVLRRSLRCGNEDFSVLLQTLLVDGDLDGISPKSVKSIDEYDLPFLWSVAVRKHTLELRPVVVGTGHGAVDICTDDPETVPRGKIVAHAQLAFDGLLGLPFTRIPRIDNC